MPGIPVAQPQEKVLHYKVPCRLWEVVGVDIFIINNKTLLCMVDYHSKLPIVKKVISLSADDLVQKAKLIFAGNRLPKKFVSDVVSNFTSEAFKYFCRQINIQQTITSSLIRLLSLYT